MLAERCSRRGDVGHRRPVLGGGQDVALARGQRADRGPERRPGELGVDDGRAAGHLPDRLGQPLDRSVLDQEPGGARRHRALEVARPSERRHHHHPTGRHRLGQSGSRLEARDVRELDVEQRHVGPDVQRRRHDARPRRRPGPPPRGRPRGRAGRRARRASSPGPRPAGSGSRAGSAEAWPPAGTLRRSVRRPARRRPTSGGLADPRARRPGTPARRVRRPRRRRW